MRRKIWIIGFISFVLPAISGLVAIEQRQKGEETCFSKSLHYTGEGMRYWYEKDDGLKSITNIPYDQLTCKQCHVKSCDVCHTKKQDQKCSYSVEVITKDFESFSLGSIPSGNFFINII